MAKTSRKGNILGPLLAKARQEAPARSRRLAGDSTPVLITRTIGLTPTAEERLLHLIAAIRERTGRKTNASAVIRALLRHADENRLAPVVATLIQNESETGEVVWGRAPGPGTWARGIHNS